MLRPGLMLFFQGQTNPKPVEAIAAIGLVPVAVGRAAVPGVVVPGAATKHMDRSHCDISAFVRKQLQSKYTNKYLNQFEIARPSRREGKK